VAVTIKVTGTLSWPPVLPQEAAGEQAKSTVPLYVPVAKPATTPELIETVSLLPVLPLGDDICSQLPLGLGVAVYERALPELVMFSVWLPGGAPGL
jgi:hypothetical protein